MGRSAFTLVELIAVIVITAILAGVAIPAVGSIADSRTAGAARTIAQHLAFARERALNSGSPTWVVFDANTDSYLVFVEPVGGAGLDDALPLADPTTGRQLGVTFDTGEYVGVRIESASFDGDPVVGFDWLGSPIDDEGEPLEADGSVILGPGLSVQVRALTGDIRIGQ